MKNLMKAAHEMVKEIKAQYPEVDYSFQLGLCIAYLSTKGEEEMVNLEELKQTVQDLATEEEGLLTMHYADWSKGEKQRVYITSNSSELGWFGLENGEFKFWINNPQYRDIAKVKRFKVVLKNFLETL